MIAFEVALHVLVLISWALCKAEASHRFLVLHRVVPPAPSWDGEPALVAALVSQEGVPEFHSSPSSQARKHHRGVLRPFRIQPGIFPHQSWPATFGSFPQPNLGATKRARPPTQQSSEEAAGP